VGDPARLPVRRTPGRRTRRAWCRAASVESAHRSVCRRPSNALLPLWANGRSSALPRVRGEGDAGAVSRSNTAAGYRSVTAHHSAVDSGDSSRRTAVRYAVNLCIATCGLRVAVATASKYTNASKRDRTERFRRCRTALGATRDGSRWTPDGRVRGARCRSRRSSYTPGRQGWSGGAYRQFERRERHEPALAVGTRGPEQSNPALARQARGDETWSRVLRPTGRGPQ